MSYVLEISDFLKDYYDSLKEEEKNSKYGQLLYYAYNDRLREELDELCKKSNQFNEFIKNVEN